MSTDISELQELLLFLCRSLVIDTEAVQVKIDEQGNTVAMKVTCSPDDMGRLIGRGGRRAQAIRVLMKAKASQVDRRVVIDFVD